MQKYIRQYILYSFTIANVLAIHSQLPAQVTGRSPESFLIIRDPKTNLSQSISEARPLDELFLLGAKGKQVQISDGAGVNYFVSEIRGTIPFIVGGALGTHTVTIIGPEGKKTVLFRFKVNTVTNIDDGGYYKKMFDLF